MDGNDIIFSQGVDFFHLKKDPNDKTNDWEIQEFKEDGRADVCWVMPYVAKPNPLNWRFLMYGYSKESYGLVCRGKSKVEGVVAGSSGYVSLKRSVLQTVTPVVKRYHACLPIEISKRHGFDSRPVYF
jgi:hypothetical protein